jgi:hypothetical protein
MSKQLVCDSCGDTTPDTEEGQRKWLGVLLHKVQVISAAVKGYDLCPRCAERVRSALTHTVDRPSE